MGDAPLFPDTVHPELPVTKERATKWLHQCEELAGVEWVPQRAWHGFRRAWATKRKGKSLQDVMYLGGWTDSKALLKLYQQPDLDSMLDALEDERPLRKAQ